MLDYLTEILGIEIESSVDSEGIDRNLEFTWNITHFDKEEAIIQIHYEDNEWIPEESFLKVMCHCLHSLRPASKRLQDVYLKDQ